MKITGLLRIWILAPAVQERYGDMSDVISEFSYPIWQGMKAGFAPADNIWRVLVRYLIVMVA